MNTIEIKDSQNTVNNSYVIYNHELNSVLLQPNNTLDKKNFLLFLECIIKENDTQLGNKFVENISYSGDVLKNNQIEICRIINQLPKESFERFLKLSYEGGVTFSDESLALMIGESSAFFDEVATNLEYDRGALFSIKVGYWFKQSTYKEQKQNHSH